jgi:hypothetical protein
MNATLTSYSLGVACLALSAVQAQSPSPWPTGGSVPVTADNFLRAESDSVFAGLVKQGGSGKFYHNREVTPFDSHIVQRANRDTLYSTGVFDLDAGPVTITLPDAGQRFMTMIVIDEDHYVFTVVYGPGTHILTKEKIGTRYAVAAIRILVDQPLRSRRILSQEQVRCVYAQQYHREEESRRFCHHSVRWL